MFMRVLMNVSELVSCLGGLRLAMHVLTTCLGRGRPGGFFGVGGRRAKGLEGQAHDVRNRNPEPLGVLVQGGILGRIQSDGERDDRRFRFRLHGESMVSPRRQFATDVF